MANACPIADIRGVCVDAIGMFVSIGQSAEHESGGVYIAA
jgi:hypothetical protein